MSNPASKPTDKPKSSTEKAIETAKAMVADQIPKVEITRAIYPLIADLPKHDIVDVFVQGVQLTPKGAVTYYYNRKREAAKNPN